jgi:hypothetical protein
MTLRFAQCRINANSAVSPFLSTYRRVIHNKPCGKSVFFNFAQGYQ